MLRSSALLPRPAALLALRRSAGLAAAAFAAVAFALATTALPASAEVITDGSLSVNVASSGEINRIILNGTAIDTSSFLQEYLVNGNSFTSGSPVVAAGNTATYTASVSGFNVSVTSTILGPLASNPTTTNVLEDQLVFSNLSGGSLSLAVLSYTDQDLRDTDSGDTVAFDADRQAVFATDALQLLAVSSQTDDPNAVLGYDVGNLGSVSRNFPTGNRVGPTGPGDTAMAIGYNFGTVGANQSRTVRFRYLASTNLSSVPSDFGATAVAAAPEPGTIALLLTAGVPLVGIVRRRAKNRA